MSRKPIFFDPPAIGLIGFGAFGRLAARHLVRHFRVLVHDPAGIPDRTAPGVTPASLAEAAACKVVLLAVPVSDLYGVVAAIAPELRPATLVVDVGSVKVVPARVMLDGLPAHVDILATHPLFGPQSSRDGIAGLNIAVCPLRGRSAWRAAAFLRAALALRVIVTTPERHDRDAALSQGLTHLIARVLAQMEPLPRRISTRSFDLMFEAIGMVRDDPPNVFDAIERLNPYAADVRHRFMRLVAALDTDIEGAREETSATSPPGSRRRRARSATALCGGA